MNSYIRSITIFAFLMGSLFLNGSPKKTVDEYDIDFDDNLVLEQDAVSKTDRLEDEFAEFDDAKQSSLKAKKDDKAAKASSKNKKKTDNPEEEFEDFDIEESKSETDSDEEWDVSPTKKPVQSPPEKVSTPSKKIENVVSATPDMNNPKILEFSGAPLREVVRALSNENKVNFILPETLSEHKVYMTLRNIGWRDALKAVLEAYSLGMIELGSGVIRIDTLSAIEKEKTDSGKLKRQEVLQTATEVRIIRLSYSKAPDLVKVIQSLLPSSEFDKRVKVEVDSRTNSIIVEATPYDLNRIETLIRRIDLETPQVKIEIRVIEVLKTLDRFFGINWGVPFNYDQGRGLGFGNLVFPNYILSAFSIDTGARSHDNGARADVHVGSLNNVVDLDARIRMAEDSKLSRSLQNNSVLVLDHEEAHTEAGLEVYFPTTTTGADGKTSTQLTTVKYTLGMDVTPHITADGSVQLQIKIENSSPIGTGNNAPPNKQLRALKTNMLRKSGETAVIGGLYTTEVSKQKNGLPFFSKIPLLSILFQSSGLSDTRRELIVMVTPTVIAKARDSIFSDQNENHVEDRTEEIEDLDVQELKNFEKKSQEEKTENQNINDNEMNGEMPDEKTPIEGDKGETANKTSSP